MKPNSKRAAILMTALLWVCGLSPCFAGLGEQDDLTVFQIYQANRQQKIANYITVDLWLTAYSLLRQRALELDENEIYQPAVASIVASLNKALGNRGDDEADRANRDFVQVLAALSSGQAGASMSPRARQEFDQVMAAAGINPSPLWGVRMDYAQFQPRGRYTRNETTQNYFRTARYSSGVLFYLRTSEATGVTPALASRYLQQLARLAQSVAQDKDLLQCFVDLEDHQLWQLGRPDDLSIVDVVEAITTDRAKNADDLRKKLLQRVKAKDRQPKIVAAVVDAGKLSKTSKLMQVLVGVRLLPLRHSAESEALQNLLYPNTGKFLGETRKVMPFGLGQVNGSAVKAFPSAYELGALLIGAGGQSILSKWQEDRFEHYAEAQQRAKTALASASALNAQHLQLMRSGFQQQSQVPSRFPTMLAFWTYQRYSDQLYQKQSVTPSGKGIEQDPPRKGAAIEPATEIYQQLAALVKQHAKRSKLAQWSSFAALLDQALTMSRQAGQNKQLSPQQEAFLNHLDKDLMALTDNPGLPVVVAIHTEPASGLVVQEGVGYAGLVKYGPARGARLSHYEFKAPQSEAMNDTKWREKLLSGKAYLHKTFPQVDISVDPASEKLPHSNDSKSAQQGRPQ